MTYRHLGVKLDIKAPLFYSITESIKQEFHLHPSTPRLSRDFVTFCRRHVAVRIGFLGTHFLTADFCGWKFYKSHTKNWLPS